MVVANEHKFETKFLLISSIFMPNQIICWQKLSNHQYLDRHSTCFLQILYQIVSKRLYNREYTYKDEVPNVQII